MKRRGAPRKHNPSIPGHIDQTRLPAGVYWDPSGQGRWYVFEERNGKPKGGTRTVAQRGATLADLFAIMEAASGAARRGTVQYVVDQYQASPAFKALSLRAQDDYAYFLKQALAYKTQAGPLGDLLVDKLSPPVFARIRDKIAATHPAKANAWLRRLKGAFAWGIQDGCCKTNPCTGVQQAKEVAKHGMPLLSEMRAVQTFALQRAKIPRNEAGHLAPYLAPFMELAYQLRLRSIEVLTLTEANLLREGILSNRRKGSLDNITRWTPGLRLAVRILKKHRASIWEGRATPLTRPLVVSESGDTLTRDGFSVAWQRMMRAAIEAAVITEEQRFTAHGIKHRGITDSADKKAGGHKTEQMRARYDHEIPVVDAPRGTSRNGANSRENIRELRPRGS